jgi:type II secretory pathway pseudopilin PulG
MLESTRPAHDRFPIMTTAPQDSAPRRSPILRIGLYLIEAVLVIVILALLLATWLPAIVGGNPP